MNKINIGHRTPLVKNPFFIEGLARSGKFLLNNILSGVKDIEPSQCLASLENIPRLAKLGFINQRVAQELIQIEVDAACYEMLIGRRFNIRKSDKSYIYNNPNHSNLLKRCDQIDGLIAVKKFYQNKLLSSFIVHETLPNIKLYLNTFPKIKIISIQRNPVSLIYSWYKRNLNKRLGTDPIMGEILIQGKNILLPWYLHNKESEYLSLNKSIDRTILSIETLFKMNSSSYHKLTLTNKKKILFIYYENLMNDPHLTIKKISKFLNKEISPIMKKILKQEKLPANKKYHDTKSKLITIKSLASPKYFNRLLELEEKYNSHSLF